MSECKKQYNRFTAHHLASHTSDHPCIYCTKTDGIGSTLKSPCVHRIGINTYHPSRAPKEVLPHRAKWKKGNAPKAEGDRADCGYDTDVDGVFGRRDGGGLRRLASGDARRLRVGCLGEGGGEGDRTQPSLSMDVDMKD